MTFLPSTFVCSLCAISVKEQVMHSVNSYTLSIIIYQK